MLADIGGLRGRVGGAERGAGVAEVKARREGQGGGACAPKGREQIPAEDQSCLGGLPQPPLRPAHRQLPQTQVILARKHPIVLCNIGEADDGDQHDSAVSERPAHRAGEHTHDCTEAGCRKSDNFMQRC